MAPTPTQAEAKPRSSRDDVLSFLDSLDSYSSPSASKTVAASTTSPAVGVVTGPASEAATTTTTTTTSAAPPVVASAEEAQSVLDFLDELTQRSSTPTATVKAAADGSLGLAKKASYPGGLSRSTSKSNVAVAASGAPRKSGESTRSRVSVEVASSAERESTPVQDHAQDQGGWGWSSVWNQASSVVQQASVMAQQARTVAEEQVKTASTNAAGLAGGIEGLRGGVMKALGENEQAKKWSEGVIEYARGAHLDQLGKDLKSQTLRSLTDLLNAVAPPIAEHEVIEVSLSHDMVGYDGIESLVYRGLSSIMDEIEGGTLVINKGDERKPKESASGDPDERNLNTVDGLAEGWKLAEADLEELITKSFKPAAGAAAESGAESTHQRSASITVPVTTCPIYLRIQPCLAPQPYAAPVAEGESADQALFFLLVLRDPTHKLVHTSLSQSMPAEWLAIPFEENEWVEDVMVDVIGRCVQVIGKAYLHSRMTAQSVAISKAREAAKLTLDSQAPVEVAARAEEAERRREAQEDAIVQAAASARVV